MIVKKLFTSPFFYLALAAGIIVASAWFLISYPPDWLWRDGTGNIEILRMAILAMGLIGGLYGLNLATQRQNTFEKQTKNAQVQLFNDRLGRGTQLLAEKRHLSLRLSGIRLLEDLAETSTKNQQKLIVRILHDFISYKCERKNEGKAASENQDQRKKKTVKDTQLAIKAVINIAETAGMSGEDISFNRLDFTGLHFKDISTSLDLDFRDAKMVSCKFLNVNIPNTDFRNVCFEDTEFNIANLTGSKFGFTQEQLKPEQEPYKVDNTNNPVTFISTDLSDCEFYNFFKPDYHNSLRQAAYAKGKFPKNLNCECFKKCNEYIWQLKDGSLRAKLTGLDKNNEKAWINIPTPSPEKADA